MKKQNYEKLNLLLNEQQDLYSEIQSLLQSEYVFLRNSDIEKINETSVLKSALFAEMQKKEQSRLELTKALALELGLKADEPRLLELAEKLEEPYATELREQKNKFDEIIQSIDMANQNNAVMVNTALRTLNGTLHAIKEVLQGKSVYQKQGKVAQKKLQQENLLSKKA